jgi:hypothetical protein
MLAAPLGGWPGQLAARSVTALGCLTLGVGIVRLTPAPWLTFGVLGMCAVDVVLLASGVGQPTAALLSGTTAGGGLPTFHHAQLGTITVDYPDLVLAAVLGGILAGRPAQPRAAVLVATLAGAYAGLLAVAPVLPATVPLALGLILLERGTVARRRSGRRRLYQVADLAHPDRERRQVEDEPELDVGERHEAPLGRRIGRDPSVDPFPDLAAARSAA